MGFLDWILLFAVLIGLFFAVRYMIKNKGIIFSRDYLLNEIWGFDFEGDDRVVDTLVKRIRKKLGDYSFLLKTIRGMGYSFDENKN